MSLSLSTLGLGLTMQRISGGFGPELVTNGTFDTDISGWTDNDTGLATWVDGRMRLERTGAGTTGGADLERQTLSWVIGRTYRAVAVIRYDSADPTLGVTFGIIGVDGVEKALLANIKTNATSVPASLQTKFADWGI